MLRDTVAKLLELPAAERVDVAMALWDSLTSAEQEAEFDLTMEQRAELDSRLAQHIADPASAIPGTRYVGSSSEERETGLVLRPQPEAELLDDWYEEQRPGLGASLRRKSTWSLAVSSRHFAPTLTSMVRHAARSCDAPYAIYFHAMSDQVVILGAVHGRRHPRRWQSRR
jgi:toxin ParE1/3/4